MLTRLDHLSDLLYCQIDKHYELDIKFAELNTEDLKQRWPHRKRAKTTTTTTNRNKAPSGDVQTNDFDLKVIDCIAFSLNAL